MEGCKPGPTQATGEQVLDTLNLDLSKSIASWIWADSVPRFNGIITYEHARLLVSEDTIRKIDLTLDLAQLSVLNMGDSILADSIRSQLHDELGYRIDSPFLTVSADAAGYQIDSTSAQQVFDAMIKTASLAQSVPLRIETLKTEDNFLYQTRFQTKLSQGYLDLALFLEQ